MTEAENRKRSYSIGHLLGLAGKPLPIGAANQVTPPAGMPMLMASNTWYKGTTYALSSVCAVVFHDSYTPDEVDMYNFNGCSLPRMPEIDTEKYPCIHVVAMEDYDDGSYIAHYIMGTDSTVGWNGKEVVAIEATRSIRYQLAPDMYGWTWTGPGESSYKSGDKIYGWWGDQPQSLVWSNREIINTTTNNLHLGICNNPTFEKTMYNMDESWAADADGTGSIMCYITTPSNLGNARVLHISGNGSGKIYANANSSNMFKGASNLGYRSSKIDAFTGLELFDTSKTVRMDSMFEGCGASDLTTLDLRSFDISNVISLDRMFFDCDSITSIKVSDKWVVRDNCSTTDMFTNCGVSEVTYVGGDS